MDKDRASEADVKVRPGCERPCTLSVYDSDGKVLFEIETHGEIEARIVMHGEAKLKAKS